MRLRAVHAVFHLLLAGCAPGPAVALPPMKTTPTADADAFRGYLAEHGLAARWSGDPAPLASPELQAAYPGFRFYYTFKSPPPPPGAHVPEVIEAHRRAMEEYQKHSLRLTVGIDERGRVHAFGAPEDFNTGLRPVKSEGEARTAAAAVLSLTGNGEVGPGVIPAGEIDAARAGEGGWTCRVSQKPRGVQGTVTFDHDGRCVAVGKSLNYSPQVPY